MSNDEFQQLNFWKDDLKICIEKDKDGKCISYAKYEFVDTIKEDLFCTKLNKLKNDKTV
jgi:hypothetical protein